MVSAVKKKQILSLFLAEVPIKGWDEDVLQAILEECNVDKAAMSILFPRGMIDVLGYLVDSITIEMERQLDKEKVYQTSIRKQISHIIMVRIRLLKQYQIAIAKSIPIWARNPIILTENLAKVSDVIWRRAGDQSTDFNYYSKRFLLGLVYLSSILYFLDDQSKDLQDTEAFVGRRIANVMQLQKIKMACISEWHHCMSKMVSFK